MCGGGCFHLHSFSAKDSKLVSLLPENQPLLPATLAYILPQFVKLTQKIKADIKNIESSKKKVTGQLKLINDKVEILENKTEIMDKELAKEIDNLASLELKEEEFCLRFRAIPKVSKEGIREQFIKAWQIIWIGRNKIWK